MKVYVWRDNEFSDHGTICGGNSILGVFTNKETAQQLADKVNKNWRVTSVEEFDLIKSEPIPLPESQLQTRIDEVLKKDS